MQLISINFFFVFEVRNLIISTHCLLQYVLVSIDDFLFALLLGFIYDFIDFLNSWTIIFFWA